MLLTGSKEESTLNFYRSAGYNSSDKTAFIWRMIMIYELATIEELQAVYDLVQQTNYQMIWICHWWKKNPMSIIRTH